MPALNLLHLVSEQTMQNLLPLLALKPAVVIQVRSKADRFHQAAERLKQAVRSMRKQPAYHDLKPEFFEVVVDEESPSVDRTRRKVGESLSLWPGAVVNLTGGTKLMSIGAYLAAEYQREPILYCDTERQQFVSLNQRCPLPPLPSVAEVAASLTVEAVMAAHGVTPGNLQHEAPSTEWLQFAQTTARLRSQSGASQEISHYVQAVRKQFHNEKGRFLHGGALKAALDAPLPGSALESVNAFLEAAVQAGVLRRAAGQHRLAPEPRAEMRMEDMQSSARRNFKLLEGTWFELTVFERLKDSSRFSDLRWQVQAADRSEDVGEIDLVGIDRRALAPTFVSCKVSSAHVKPLEHILSLRQQANARGGTFSRALLCLGTVLGEPQRVEFERFSGLANVTTLFSLSELDAWLAASPAPRRPRTFPRLRESPESA